MAYATLDQLDDYLDGDPRPPHPQRLLDQASIDIDIALTGAVYDTDDNGIATDADIAAAITLATILQALYIAPDPQGKKAQYSSMTSSQVSWTRATRADGSPVVQKTAPAALNVLQACPELWWAVCHG